jgi:predicted enzyme related to lactoylglutathione lyase
MNFNGVLIGSEDPQQLKSYYTKLFGKPTFEDSTYFGWQFGHGGVSFGPHDQVKGKNKEPGRIIWNIETADVKGEFAKLQRAGATVVREPYKAGDEGDFWIATLTDPDGNYFQLMTPMEMPEQSREDARPESAVGR